MANLSNLLLVRKLKYIKSGVVATIALLLFCSTTLVSADWGQDQPFYTGLIDIDKDRYMYFGNDEHPKSQSYGGIEINVDESSKSAQWINIGVVVPRALHAERSIDKFYMLCNGKVCDEWYPTQMEYPNGTIDFRNYYLIKPTISELIGTAVYFQVVAVHTNRHGDETLQWAVAWSEYSQTTVMKPLPVHDEKSWDVLLQILAKLEQLRNMLESLLQQIKKAIEDIYTPKPETLAEFNQAMNELEKKLPMLELAEQADEFQRSLEDAKRKLKRPGEELKLGGRVCLVYGNVSAGGQMSCVQGGEVTFLDLTQWRTQVLLFRTIMEATIWVFFFYMLFKMLTPKPRL